MTGFDSIVPTPNIKGCWYKLYWGQCPVCGKTEHHRTRMPGPKPPWKYGVTHETVDLYCGCMY